MNEINPNILTTVTREDVKRLKEARHVNFHRIPVSETAHEFSIFMWEAIQSRLYEKNEKALQWTLKREEKFWKTIDSIICDLAYQHLLGEGEFLYMSLRSSAYKASRYQLQNVSYTAVKDAFDILLSNDLQMIEAKFGYQGGKGYSGRSTRIRPSDRLSKIIDFFGLTLSDFGEADNKETIVLRDEKENPTSLAKLTEYEDTPTTIRMRQEMTLINDFIGSLDVTCPHQHDPNATDLVRIFNNSDFNLGGRLYRGWWQTMPYRERVNIEINGMETVELDFCELHPTMLYAEVKDAQLPKSAYEIDDMSRKEAKVLFNAMLNAKRELSNWPKDLEGESMKMSLEQAQTTIKSHHSGIGSFFHSGKGLELQRNDSDLIVATILDLMRRGIPALPIHDSLIVPELYADEVEEVMKKWFLRLSGAEVEVKLAA
ncbi:hypothetical protein GUA87_00190 [Sneathiella sp. P13V-1]|uniref:hypothetical protein n=1 Tax=Sneathiella sp. P13V-1 TaxID=2697366 RepID=UPI00187BBFF5|nr:hypothetical protein [Sneathiella sp. P13V-1]MBE7635247.1 hypothetical protein [Sneathiella sp. P13V-1]